MKEEKAVRKAVSKHRNK